MTGEQKETLVKELEFSAEKGREEMARLKEGMAELLDERVGDCVYLSQLPNVFVQFSKCICPGFKICFSKFQNVFVFRQKDG